MFSNYSVFLPSPCLGWCEVCRSLVSCQPPVSVSFTNRCATKKSFTQVLPIWFHHYSGTVSAAAHKNQGLSAFLKMALSSLMMQRFNSSEKRKGKKSNKEAVTRMPSIPHNKKTVCHSWVCATQISRKSGPDALRMLVHWKRHKYRPGQRRYTSHEMY